MNYASKLIEVALAEEGYLEKKTDAMLDDKKANAGYNNYTKYGRDLVKLVGSPYANGVAWCDMFVDWCFIQAFGLTEAKKLLGGWSAYTPTSATYFKGQNRFYTSDPQVGDQIFFKKSNGTICHTGIVYKVDNQFVYTIEGNTSTDVGVIANGGGVCKKRYALVYGLIAGYGRPKYDKEVVGWIKDSVGWWYRYSNGEYPKSKWLQIRDKWYYFDDNGYMCADEYIKSSDYDTNKKLYYVTSNGEWNNKAYRWMQDEKGWWLAEIGGRWYAHNEFAVIDGETYYFGEDGYMLASRIKTIDGNVYEFGSDGAKK